MSDRICVYTSVTGNYERLNEQPIAAKSSCDFICITDEATTAVSSTWKILRRRPLFERDPARSQRAWKCDASTELKDYGVSLYIDNTVQLTERPEDIVAKYLESDRDMVCFEHSFRETVLAEFDAVAELGLADWGRLAEQMDHYDFSDPNLFGQKPLWGGILIRRHHADTVKAAMQNWFLHICRYSARDQLSLNFVLRQKGVKYKTVALDNLLSWFHQWPIASERVGSGRPHGFERMPMRLRILSLEDEVKRLRRASVRDTSVERLLKRLKRFVLQRSRRAFARRSFGRSG